jgi:hypothetical protein
MTTILGANETECEEASRDSLQMSSRFSNRLSRSQASRGPVYGGASPAPSNVERFSESAALN